LKTDTKDKIHLPLKMNQVQSTSSSYQISFDGENGGVSGSQNIQAPKMPAHLAKRLNKTKKQHSKRGTPAEREAAVAARREQQLAVTKAKARKHIEKCEAMIERKKAMVAAQAALDAQQESGEPSQESKK
jgi:hypothetical protein